MIVNQLIRRVDVYRGYQINISFNFDLTLYIEGKWCVHLQNSRTSNKHFQKQRNSKNWGLPSMRLQNQAFGWFSMQPLRKQKEKHRTSNEVQCFFWWRIAGSNRWPLACHASALPNHALTHPHAKVRGWTIFGVRTLYFKKDTFSPKSNAVA